MNQRILKYLRGLWCLRFLFHFGDLSGFLDQEDVKLQFMRAMHPDGAGSSFVADQSVPDMPDAAADGVAGGVAEAAGGLDFSFGF